jgi:shikimate dehydrogenase
MTSQPYAEIIGDPVAHSRSPAIHNFWLRSLGLSGEYRATRVSQAELPAYLAQRRADPDWCGCNLTAPLKRSILPHLDRLSLEVEAIGAANCVMPDGDALVGLNTDIDGVAEALGTLQRPVREAAIIGAGGAARAAASYLFGQGCRTIHLLVRRPEKVTNFLRAGSDCRVVAHPIDESAPAVSRSTLLINASPLGMTHVDPPPAAILDAICSARQLMIFDMVYDPEETVLLRTGREAGHKGIGGLTMLIGQARHAFWLFFGNQTPRAKDRKLRNASSKSPDRS